MGLGYGTAADAYTFVLRRGFARQLICNTQNRSSATRRAPRQRGYAHVRYVSGGMSEWARRGWPMVKTAT